jgi:hypothetical protein
MAFSGYDGAAHNLAAYIRVSVDGTPVQGRVPARIDFATQSSAAAGTYPRMSIAGNGNVGIGTTAPQTLFQVGDDQGFERLDRGKIEVWWSKTEASPRVEIAQNVSGGTGGPTGAGILFGPGNQYTFANSGSGIGWPDVYSSKTLAFWTSDGAKLVERMRIAGNGNVGIGETNPQHKLAVNGTIKAREVIVETTGWSDYVFADDYRLAPLSEVESHIKTNRHLPGIPSATQVAEQGVSLGDMQAKLLAKVEELTLHVIAQEKHMLAQERRIAALESENASLKVQP